MYVISGKKRESSPFRHIVKSLMHPYSVRSGYIRFPTVTNHQGFAQFGLSGRQGKILPAKASTLRDLPKESLF